MKRKQGTQMKEILPLCKIIYKINLCIKKYTNADRALIIKNVVIK